MRPSGDCWTHAQTPDLDCFQLAVKWTGETLQGLHLSCWQLAWRTPPSYTCWSLPVLTSIWSVVCISGLDHVDLGYLSSSQPQNKFKSENYRLGRIGGDLSRGNASAVMALLKTSPICPTCWLLLGPLWICNDITIPSTVTQQSSDRFTCNGSVYCDIAERRRLFFNYLLSTVGSFPKVLWLKLIKDFSFWWNRVTLFNFEMSCDCLRMIGLYWSLCEHSAGIIKLMPLRQRGGGGRGEHSEPSAFGWFCLGKTVPTFRGVGGMRSAGCLRVGGEGYGTNSHRSCVCMPAGWARLFLLLSSSPLSILIFIASWVSNKYPCP